MKKLPKNTGSRSVRLSIGLSDDLGYKEIFLSYATRYRSLGWALVALDPRGNLLLPADFQEPEAWFKRLEGLLEEPEPLNLGVRTGAPSRLLVLEVEQGEGETLLDRLGDWRSSCRARGGGRERHYFLLPSDWQVPASLVLTSLPLKLFGEGGTVLVPPSIEPEAREPWRWLAPPWEWPLAPPGPAVWRLLKDYSPGSLGPEPELPAWEQIFELVSPHAPVLTALLAPAASFEDYYGKLYQAALQAGVRDRQTLLGLLWHAPQGRRFERPDRWDYLQKLVADPVAQPPGDSGNGKQMAQLQRLVLDTVLAEAQKLVQHPALMAPDIEWGAAEPPEDVMAGPAPPGSPTPAEAAALEFLEELTSSLYHRFRRTQTTRDLEAAFKDHLTENPQLAADLEKVRMLHYCLFAYIKIHPDFCDFAPQERVLAASRLACDFLDQLARGLREFLGEGEVFPYPKEEAV